MMPEWGICLMIAGAVFVLVILQIVAGNQKPFRRVVLFALIGIGMLTVLNVISPLTGVSLPVSRLSICISALLGIPGITMMLLLQLLW